MSRWKASGIHLLISLFLAVLAIILMLLVFYPPPYTGSAGAGRLLLILVGVDVTLGPLITLIIFKQNKPSLKFDLTVIAVLQITALAYGLYVISQARPIYLAFLQDRFSLVSANMISDDELAQAQPPFDIRPLFGPVLVGTYVPEHSRSIVMDNVMLGRDLDVLPRFFIEYRQQIDLVLAQGKPLEELADWSDEAAGLMKDWLGDKNPDSYIYYPMMTNHGYRTLVLGKADAKPVAVLAVDPW